MTDVRLGSMVAELSGNGPPVVMVHGLGGSSNSFQPLMAALDGFRVLRPDLPGAGRSAPRPGRPGLAGLAAAVRDMMRAQGIARAHLVGHSMGTLLCQYLAAAEPALVAGLTLYGPMLEPPPPARDALRQRAEAARREGMAGIAEAIASGSLAPSAATRSPAAVAFVRESVMRQDPGGYAAHCLGLSEAKAADHSAIACPTHLIAGAEDKVAPPEMARALAGRIAGARLDLLPDCGHWAMIEAPEAAARLLRADLSETDE